MKRREPPEDDEAGEEAGPTVVTTKQIMLARVHQEPDNQYVTEMERRNVVPGGTSEELAAA